MAKPSDGGTRPPPDLLLTDISGEGPGTQPESATSREESRANEPKPDAPSKPGGGPSSGEERPAGSGAEEKSGEIRGAEDGMPREPTQSRDDLGERLEGIEAAVGELPALREMVAEGAGESRLVRLAVAAVSRENDGLKDTSSTLVESAVELKRLSLNLKLSEEQLWKRLKQTTRIEDDVSALKRLVWGAIIAIPVLAGVVQVALSRLGLI